MTDLPTTDVRPDRSTLVAFVGVVLFGAVNAIAVRQIVTELAPFWAASTRFLAAGLIIGSVVMFALYLFALERWTASAVSYVTLLMPLVTVPLAAILIGERITVSLIVGGGLVLVGVYVGAFANVHRARVATPSLPECMPAGDRLATPAEGSAARPG